jgi:hypothetical protein
LLEPLALFERRSERDLLGVHLNRALRATTGNALRMHCVRCGGCAMRHRRETSTYACRNPASTSFSRPAGATRRPAIAQKPKSCRAEASSMPEGPAVGRVEAKRRALTTPSTAPA